MKAETCTPPLAVTGNDDLRAILFVPATPAYKARHLGKPLAIGGEAQIAAPEAMPCDNDGMRELSGVAMV